MGLGDGCLFEFERRWKDTVRLTPSPTVPARRLLSAPEADVVELAKTASGKNRLGESSCLQEMSCLSVTLTSMIS